MPCPAWTVVARPAPSRRPLQALQQVRSELANINNTGQTGAVSATGNCGRLSRTKPAAANKTYGLVHRAR